MCNQPDIVILHRYGDQSHFMALATQVNCYLTCDPFFTLARAVRGRITLRTMLFDLGGILRGYVSHPRTRNYVYGFAPESAYFTLLCLIWWRSGRRVLFSSFSDQIDTLSPVRRHLLRFNLLFARKFFDAAAAVSLAAECTLAPYLDTVMVEHSIDVEAYRRHDKRSGLIFLGRITPYKNVDLVIAAATVEGFNLDLVGPLEMDAKFLQNTPEQVRHLGPRTKDWIKGSLGRYQALILASDPREPFGIVLIEAMAAGTLVVASHTHGSQTIFRDWPDYPLLFDSSSPTGLLEALKRLRAMPLVEQEKVRSRLIIMASDYRPDARARSWKKVLT